ncbi:MAG TPA: hypothetical protein VKA92_12165, partial [Segetibacter sp.]|nr:hypothetical protein [Segetibacter sp.]
MKNFSTSLFFGLITIISGAQSSQSIVDEKEVQRIETVLSSDSMQGRKAFTPGSEKAADFINDEFKKIGLETVKAAKSYKQTFSIISPKVINISASFEGNSIDPKRLILLTSQPDLTITAKSGFEKVYIQQASELSKSYGEFIKLKENLLVFVDRSLAKNFIRLSGRK